MNFLSVGFLWYIFSLIDIQMLFFLQSEFLEFHDDVLIYVYYLNDMSQNDDQNMTYKYDTNWTITSRHKNKFTISELTWKIIYIWIF